MSKGLFIQLLKFLII